MASGLKGLFAKGKVAMFASLNELLDKQVNTPEGLAEYIRQLEDAMDQLGDSVAEAAGAVTGYQRDIAKKTKLKSDKENDADLLFSNEDTTDDDFALQLQTEATGLEEEIGDLQAQLTDAQDTHGKLAQAMANLTARHDEMVKQLQKLRIQDRGAQAKDKAVDALRAAGTIDGAGPRVDDVVRRIQQHADASDARLEAAMGRLSGGDGGSAKAVALAKAKAALIERRQKTASAGVEASQADTTAGSSAS